MTVHLIGRWCWGVAGCTCGKPTPTTLATPEQQEQQAAIVAYLRRAPRVEDAGPRAPCRYASCAFRLEDARDRSDGVWRWSGTMAHYVEVHGLKIPEAMYAAMRANRFVPPATVDPKATLETSGEAWERFALQEGGAAPWRAGVSDADQTVAALNDALRELQTQLSVGRRPVGYWAPEASLAMTWLPWPTALVDESWAPADRAQIVDWLKRGPVVEEWKGASVCRFDGCNSGGTADLSDGFFIWPQDYWHFIELHRVRPPDDLIAHIRARLSAG